MVFDLRKQLRIHSNGLLQQFFAGRGELLDLDWDGLTKTEVGPIVAAIQALPPAKRREVQVFFQRVDNLVNNRGLRVIREELSQRHPEKVPTFGALKNRADKVLWVYLNAHDAFEEAVVFARADSLSVGRCFNRWSDAPCGSIAITDERIEALKSGLRTHYSQKELRGEHCEVHHFTRLNGDEYFFAYLPDWPDNFLVFNDDGEMEPLDIPAAFTNVFVYEPATGALDMIASGGLPVQQELRRVFYQAMCGITVEDADPDRPEYQLDHLLDSGFSFPTELQDGIERITVPSVLLVPLVEAPGIKGLEIRFQDGVEWSESRSIINSFLASRDLSPLQVGVDCIFVRFQFLGDGTRRGKVLKLRISPRTCNLKRIDEEELQEVVTRCIRRWEVIG